MTLNDAVKKMRGKPNTPITLTIVRKGEAKPRIITLNRAVIQIQRQGEAARTRLRLLPRDAVPGTHRRAAREAHRRGVTRMAN
jgi:C-terminal processing protease CtpA/Prc